MPKTIVITLQDEDIISHHDTANEVYQVKHEDIRAMFRNLLSEYDANIRIFDGDEVEEHIFYLEEHIFGIETERNKYLRFIEALSVNPAHTKYWRQAAELTLIALGDDGEEYDEFINYLKDNS